MTWDELASKFDDNAARELKSADEVIEASRLWRNVREQSSLTAAVASITTNKAGA